MASYLPLVKRTAKRYGLDWKLVAAVIYQESRGDPYAVRYEPNFYRIYIEGKTKNRLRGHWPNYVSETTERHLRSTSFGLMQVMGQTARENGWDGQYLTQLCDPAQSINVGCAYLHKMSHRAERKGITGDSAQRYMLLRYNGSALYPDLIYAHITSGAYKEI